MKNSPKLLLKLLANQLIRLLKLTKMNIARREKKISDLKQNRKTATEAQKENIDRNINEQQEQIDALERENEEIEGRMSLRDKIKVIFKKHSFTLTAVVVAVSVVISVLAANLKKGLTTLGSKLGSGLKDVGRKLGQILPGLCNRFRITSPQSSQKFFTFHVYYTVRKIWNEMGVPLPGDSIFNQKN